MIHELKDIIFKAREFQELGVRTVLASVVLLEGSSYRKPGVRMLIAETGQMIGAVSGGCVEKEVKLRAKSVFRDQTAKVITYDGRYRLGCEGVLYILIEPLFVKDEFLEVFQVAIKNRTSLNLSSYYKREDESIGYFGTTVQIADSSYFLGTSVIEKDTLDVFQQDLVPTQRLIVIGGEHDAVQLCTTASFLGWDVEVITSMNDPKNLQDFPGATKVSANSPELIHFDVDTETVIVLMTHNYTYDLKYLLKLSELQLKYIGVLGSSKRRIQLENDLFTYQDQLSDAFLNTIYSPTGLNIGAITPQEIAVSIVAEILSVLRDKKPASLKKLSINTLS